MSKIFWNHRKGAQLSGLLPVHLLAMCRGEFSALMAWLMSSYLRSGWKNSCKSWMFVKENPDKKLIIIKQCVII